MLCIPLLLTLPPGMVTVDPIRVQTQESTVRAKITDNRLKSLKATGKGYDVNDTELAGFAARVSAEGKSTCYSVRYRTPNGRRQRLKIGPVGVLSPAQARDLAQQALAEVIKGDDPQDIKKCLRGVKTLGEFVEEEYHFPVLSNHRKEARFESAGVIFATPACT